MLFPTDFSSRQATPPTGVCTNCGMISGFTGDFPANVDKHPRVSLA